MYLNYAVQENLNYTLCKKTWLEGLITLCKKTWLENWHFGEWNINAVDEGKVLLRK